MANCRKMIRLRSLPARGRKTRSGPSPPQHRPEQRGWAAAGRLPGGPSEGGRPHGATSPTAAHSRGHRCSPPVTDSMANILVVDDYRDTAESMALWLKYFGHDVQIARDGHQAIEIARRQRPEVLSCSISACPASTVIKSPPPSAGKLRGPLAIIAVTGFGREEDRRRALVAGCDHHLVKPIDPAALITLLPTPNTQRGFSRSRRDADRGPQPEGRPATQPTGRDHQRPGPPSPGRLTNSSASPSNSRPKSASHATAARPAAAASSTWPRSPPTAAPGSNWTPTDSTPRRPWTP